MHQQVILHSFQCVDGQSIGIVGRPGVGFGILASRIVGIGFGLEHSGLHQMLVAIQDIQVFSVTIRYPGF
ncbi:hypothetical protein DA83_21520 [Pseudomonas sp. 250J]|nr:hypothetical protein DA83_21520 [Pseudomonas sp. 250J]